MILLITTVFLVRVLLQQFSVLKHWNVYKQLIAITSIYV